MNANKKRIPLFHAFDVKLAGAARAAGDVEGRVWLETRDRERREESEVSLQTREVQRGSYRRIYGAIINLI